MSADRFQIGNSAVVAAQFRQMLASAEAQGRLTSTLAAVRWVMSELERTPMEFGESREYLPAARIRVRCGFARPVYVE